jgi:hypothetical protein
MPRSRHQTRYGEAVVAEIRRRLAAGDTPRSICAGDAMPSLSTVYRWWRAKTGPAVRTAAADRHARSSPARYVRLTDGLMDEICRRLAEGEFLVAICRDRHMPSRQTVYNHVHSDDEFRERYAEARALQVEHLFEQIVAIADEDDNPARARLRIDARKWLVVKLDPERFGDKAADRKAGTDTEMIIGRLERGRARNVQSK